MNPVIFAQRLEDLTLTVTGATLHYRAIVLFPGSNGGTWDIFVDIDASDTPVTLVAKVKTQTIATIPNATEAAIFVETAVQA